ncbi:MAG: hypothetical protein Q7U75_16475 [Desulfobacterales bacterium]|nr:hypothetical protein [Desulfobacterales bacterium]
MNPRPVVAIDPGRNSGIAWLVPVKGGSGVSVTIATRAVKVPSEVGGLSAVRLAVDMAATAILAAGFRLDEVEVVVEIQHVRFAAAALVVTEVRRTWEVYAFERFGIMPAQVHPSEWRSRFGLNKVKAGGKKDAARDVLDAVISGQGWVFEAYSRDRKRTEDECEAALMALGRLGVCYAG